MVKSTSHRKFTNSSKNSDVYGDDTCNFLMGGELFGQWNSITQIPITFLASLFNLESIAQKLGFLSSVSKFGPILVGFLQGFLPSLLLVIFIAIVPSIFRLMANYQGLYSHSDVAASVARNYFWFQVINVFFISILSTSIFGLVGQITDIVNSPTMIFSLLGSSLPKQVC